MVYTPSQKQDTFGPEFYADRQKMFDYVVDRLVEQGQPSSDRYGACAYTIHKEGGKIIHCGVGHILPAYILAGITDHDKRLHDADDNWNNKSFTELVPAFDAAQVALPFPERDDRKGSDWYTFEKFMGDIQAAHDGASQREEFLPQLFRSMYNVAYTYQLDTFSLDHYRLSLGISLI